MRNVSGSLTFQNGIEMQVEHRIARHTIVSASFVCTVAAGPFFVRLGFQIRAFCIIVAITFRAFE